MLKKPEPTTKTMVYYDWFEVKRYLIKKYKDFDYKGIWHTMCDLYGVKNDSYEEICEESFVEDWESDSTKLDPSAKILFDEFGSGPLGERTIQFHISW